MSVGRRSPRSLVPPYSLRLRFSFLAMTTQLLSPEAREFTARALLVGQRIDLRALGSTQRLGGGPLAVSIRGGGAAIIFRYGAVVLFDVQPLEQDEFLRQLEPRI